MPGAEISNLKAKWSGGALVITDLNENAIITIYPSSGGVSFSNAGGLTVSTGILGGLTVSSGLTLHSDLTMSSGRIAPTGQKTLTVTTATTLTASSAGCAVLVTASDTIVTLPGAASTGKQLSYTICSTLTTAGQVVIKTTTTETICGGGIAAAAGIDILSNTAATHVDGDFVSLMNAAVSTSWSIMGMAGTWASTT